MLQSLKVIAHLAGSISLSRCEDLALDGILATQILRRYYGNDFYYLPDPKEQMVFACLPLEMRGQPSEAMQRAQTGDIWMSMREMIQDTSLWYWSCSTAQIEAKGRDTQYWNKRFDTQAELSDHVDFGGKVEKIIIEQGRYKAYHMPLPTLITDQVIWYVYGDRECMQDLLQDVVGISKKRSQGNGHVLTWSIELMEQDWSEWQNNELMRPIPVQLFSQQEATPLNMQHIAYRAPQWHQMNQTFCVTKAQRQSRKAVQA